MVPETFEHYFAVNGALEAIQDAFISAETSGQIQAIHVQEGQRVQQGDLLVSLNSDIIRNGVAEVKNALELARTVFRKRQELWDTQDRLRDPVPGGQDQQGERWKTAWRRCRRSWPWPRSRRPSAASSTRSSRRRASWPCPGCS